MSPAWYLFHSLGISVSAVLAYGTFVPSSRIWGPIVLRAPKPPRQSVALTFDDGPTAGPTEKVLDILGEHGIKAAFFVVGRNCVRWPGLVRRMHDEGHLVANHTWDHSHSGWRGSQRYWDSQLSRTSDIIEQIIGHRPAMFRAPMGIKTCFTLRAAKRQGCQTIGWTRRARDGGPTTRAQILDRLQDTSVAGDILLLHDGVEPNSPGRDPGPTIEALPLLLRRLRNRELICERLDQLLGLPGYLHCNNSSVNPPNGLPNALK